MFEIEISNPFFTGPSSILLSDLTAPKNQGIGKQGTIVSSGKNDAKNVSN